MFKQAATYNNTTDLQEYTETVTAYITKCIDDVTVTKTITVRANQKPWLTGEVYRLLKARNAAFRAGDEDGLRTARANLSTASERQETVLQEDSPSFQRQQRHSEPVAGIQTITDYKPPPQTCDSTIPCWTSWMPSLLALRHKTAPLHRRLHLLTATRWWRCPRTAWGEPSAGSMTQSSGSWQHSWACDWETCSGTHWCLHRHLQHLTKSGCCPHMLQSYHHHSSPEEVISILLQWLPSSSTHSYSHEVLWTASHATHQVCPPPPPWTPSSCI